MLPTFLFSVIAQCSSLCRCRFRGLCDRPLKHTLPPLQDVNRWTPRHVAAFVRSVGGDVEGEPSWHQKCTVMHRYGASCGSMLHELYVLAAAVNLSSTVNGASFRRFLTNGSFPKAVGDVRTMGPLLQQAQSAIYSWLPELPAQPGHDPQSVVPAVLRLMTALQE
eukprot:2933554-Prymnesium_polylepis.2